MWEGWRTVVGVEVCGRGGGVWEGWRSVVGGGGVWEGWRNVVGGVEECGRKGRLCGGRGECECGRGFLEGVRCVGGEGWMWVVGG